MAHASPRFVLLSQENSRDRSGERVSRFPRQETLLRVSRGSSFPVSKKQVRFLRETQKTVELISTRTNPNFPPPPCTRGKINWCFTPCFSIRGKRSIIRFRSICCSGTRDQSAQPLASEKFDSLFRVVRIRFAYRCSFTLSIFICFEITGPDNGTVAQSTNEGDTWRPGMR